MAAVLVCWTGAPSVARGADDPWLGPDKALHFSAGFALSAGGYGLSSLAFDERLDRVLVGAGVALGAGAAKELVDMAGLGSPSWRDFAWDAIGTGCGVLLAWVVDRFLFGDQPPAPTEPSSERSDFGAGAPPSAAVATPVPDDLLAPSQIPRPVLRNLRLQERLQWDLDVFPREPIRVADHVVLHRFRRPLDAADHAMERLHCVGQCARRWTSRPLGAL